MSLPSLSFTTVKQKYTRVGVSEEEVHIQIQKGQQRFTLIAVVAVVVTIGVVVGVTQAAVEKETPGSSGGGGGGTQTVVDDTIGLPAGIPSNFPALTGWNIGQKICLEHPGPDDITTAGKVHSCPCDNDENPCKEGYTCNFLKSTDTIGNMCIKPYGINCVDTDDETFHCADCNTRADGACTSDLVHYCLDDNTCAMTCGAINVARTTPAFFDYPCGCVQQSGNRSDSSSCPEGHICLNPGTETSQCSFKCKHRFGYNSPFEYDCGCDGGVGAVNRCAPGFSCKDSKKCEMECDYYLRPSFQDYECKGHIYEENECLKTHRYNEATQMCVWNSCGQPDVNECHCHTGNPCSPGFECVKDPTTPFSTCTKGCGVVPDGDFNSVYACPGCTQDYVVNQTLEDELYNDGTDTFFNPCAKGYRCDPGSGCTYIDGPAGFTQGFDETEVCLTDGTTGFLGYAHWRLIPDDPLCAGTEELTDRRCITDSDANLAAGSSLACTCADIHNILDPNTGCSPFLQHTTFGRNLLFDFLPAEGSQNGKRGILTTEFLVPGDDTLCNGDITGTSTTLTNFHKMYAFERDEGGPPNSREERFSDMMDAGVITTEGLNGEGSLAEAECIKFKTHKTGLYRKGFGDFSQADRIADYFMGGPSDLRDAAAFERLRDDIYENEVYYGDPTAPTNMYKESQFANDMEQQRLTLYEVIVRYVKPEHIVKCGELPGVLYSSKKEKLARPYKSIFAEFMTNLSNTPLTGGANTDDYTPEAYYKETNDYVKEVTHSGFTSKEMVKCNATVTCPGDCCRDWLFDSWEAFRDKYTTIKDSVSNKEKSWSALDVLLYELNQGIPYDFQVTSKNWQDQLCIWNGVAAQPIGVTNVQGSVLKTDRSGSTGSLCLDCRIEGADGTACKGSTCSTAVEVSMFEATRGECGRQPNPNKCMCQHPREAKTYEDQHGVFQLHWSSWESNMVRDTNGDSAGQCGKAVKCYANPHQSSSFSDPTTATLEDNDFSKFQPYEYFAIGSSMEATCKCGSPFYYSAKTNQYDYCESLTAENKERTDLIRCETNQFLAEVIPHGNHYPRAVDIVCDCTGGAYYDVETQTCQMHKCIPKHSGKAWSDATGNVLEAGKNPPQYSNDDLDVHYDVDSEMDKMLKREQNSVNGQCDTTTTNCVCSCRIDEREAEKDGVDPEEGQLSKITSYYGNLCQHKLTCTDHNIPGKNTTSRPITGASGINPERECVCAEDDEEGNFIQAGFAGEKCQRYYDCHDGYLEFDDSQAREGPRCHCHPHSLDQLTLDRMDESVSDFTEKYLAYFNSDEDIRLKQDFVQARRRLLPGYWESDDCDSEYHHCVFGKVGDSTECPLGQDQCCICFSQWTGEYCDVPCGFMCTTDPARSKYSGSFNSDGELWRGGEWMAYVDPETGSCMSRNLDIFNDAECADGSCARSNVFGATFLGVKRQLERGLRCGTGDDPWLDLFDQNCKTFEAVAVGGTYAGPDKIFQTPTQTQFMEYTRNFDTSGAIVWLDTTDATYRDFVNNNLKVNGWSTDHYKNNSEIDETTDNHDMSDCSTGDTLDEQYCTKDEIATPVPHDDVLKQKAGGVVRYVKRLLWFIVQAQEEDRRPSPENGWTKGDWTRLPPWFRSDGGGIYSTGDEGDDGKPYGDKCDHPVEFPPGARSDSYWSVSIERMTTSEVEGEGGNLGAGDDMEIFDLKLKMKYSGYSPTAVSNYAPYDMPRDMELRPGKGYNEDGDFQGGAEFTAIHMFSDSDDDFDCFTRPDDWDLGQRFAEDYAAVVMGRNEEEDLEALREAFDEYTQKIVLRNLIVGDVTEPIYGFKHKHWYNKLKTQFPAHGGRFAGCEIPFGENYLRGENSHGKQYFRLDNLEHIHVTSFTWQDWDFWSANDDQGGSRTPNLTPDKAGNCGLRTADKPGCEWDDTASDLWNDWTEDTDTGKWFKWFRFYSSQDKKRKKRYCLHKKNCVGTCSIIMVQPKQCREERAQIFVKLVRTESFL